MALKRVTHTSPLRRILNRFPQRVGGRRGFLFLKCYEALGVILSETASGADLGGSSKYSNENFED